MEAMADMKKLMIAAAVLLLLTACHKKARAHDWYPHECCAQEHCHPIDCEAITKSGIGLMYQGLSFSGKMIRNSHDEKCHACIVKPQSSASGQWPGSPVCIFIQNNI
jgi:hypothetical protein